MHSGLTLGGQKTLPLRDAAAHPLEAPELDCLLEPTLLIFLLIKVPRVILLSRLCKELSSADMKSDQLGDLGHG